MPARLGCPRQEWDDNDLRRSDGRREDEAHVVAVRHDDGADESRRSTPRSAPGVQAEEAENKGQEGWLLGVGEWGGETSFGLASPPPAFAHVSPCASL